MVGTLLLRGMLVGILAGLLCFVFLRVFGEPQVERAIAFESRHGAVAAAEGHHHAAEAGAEAGAADGAEEPEVELVSRSTQAGLGLFTGVVVYAAAFGGLFALVFAAALGRMGDFGPRATSAFLAAAGFVSVYLVPSLKYPANPPAVGDPGTIGMRTSLYFAFVALSLAAVIAAAMARRRLLARLGGWNASLLAGAAYLAVVLAVGLLLPGVDEVPEGFPASLLWQFRIASTGSQFLMWTIIGLVFGALTERTAAATGGRLRLNPAMPR